MKEQLRRRKPQEEPSPAPRAEGKETATERAPHGAALPRGNPRENPRGVPNGAPQALPERGAVATVPGLPTRGSTAPFGAAPTSQKRTGEVEAGLSDPSAEALSASLPRKQVIGVEQLRTASTTLLRYKQGKANLERKIVENEQWYKLRHWECLRGEKKEVQPASGWLFHAIANKHADAMDNYPIPNILPREEGDKGEAEMLSSIVPVLLEQCDFEQVWSEVWTYKLKTGTGVYGVFWDPSKLNGLGDVVIRKVDLLNLFWESGVTDLQKSQNVFHVELMDNEVLKAQYPQLENKLGGGDTGEVARYFYDDTVDVSDKSSVIDWYYRKRVGGRTVLHYCKYVNDVVLFATENDPSYAERGWYDHGQYPFVFDVLYPIEGTPTGFGYIDIGKDAQEYIDRGNEAILRNMLVNARPRFFVRDDSAVNPEEFADLTRDFVRVSSGVGDDSIRPISGQVLSDIYVSILNNKIEELKETTGTRDISTGGTTSGVTAAAAIAAMQEAGSKLSRDSIKASYRAYRKVVLMVIELLRQFYTLPRCFRILGENGTARYVKYKNSGIQLQKEEGVMGGEAGYRLPLFDIEITAEKASPYSKMGQNELALQFLSAGFFHPQNADQALACLDMMDFDRKQFVMQKIAENGGMYRQMMAMQQQMLMLAQMVDQMRGSHLSEQLAAQFGGTAAPATPGGTVSARSAAALGGSKESSENTSTKKARQRVAESTTPT